MKHILKVAALAFIFITPGIATHSMAQEFNCKSTDLPQIALNKCAWREYQQADKQLNAVWKLIKKYAADVDSENTNNGVKSTAAKDLLNGQRGWIKYRDGHCDMVAAQFGDGTMRPQALNMCLEKLTSNRTFQLAEILKGQ